MCGVGGVVFGERDRVVPSSLLEAMGGAIRHRGPDEGGIWQGGGVGMVHRRLSIIDVAAGQQPMENEDGGVKIVFNGEIYNHHDLRGDLEAKGHHFRTASDTEAIVHLYEEEGERCVERLRGMFAFAIWNQSTRELLLARDPVGKKPLYYAELPEGLIFASELKALLAYPGLSSELDHESVQDYLALQYVPAPGSIFKAVKKLAPGHTLVWRDGKLGQPRRFWELKYQTKLELSVDEAAEQVLAELDEAVKIRLESEVPLGCLLSGGIDSSAVVALMRRHNSGVLRTFSIGFEDEAFNELPFARQIAEKFETEHEEMVVRPDTTEVLSKMVWHLDEPMADPSALPTWYVAEMCRKHLTVALNGDGGDESFAGYSRYRGTPLVERYAKLPDALRRHAVKPTVKMLEKAFTGSLLVGKLQRLNEISLGGKGAAYVDHMAVFLDPQRQALCADGMFEDSLSREPLRRLLAFYDGGDAEDAVDRQLQCDVEGYLPGDLLVKMDRMAMAHGLEGRSPFLDKKLMEFTARLPSSYKLRDGQLKWILKKSLEGLLPHEILHRKKKGFSVPLKDWFKGPLREMAHDLLLGSRCRQRGMFDAKTMARLLSEHESGKANHHHRLWSLLCFEVWCRNFLDQENPAAGPACL
jgi:asparagine synthase (glutamine-hydrolysing)